MGTFHATWKEINPSLVSITVTLIFWRNSDSRLTVNLLCPYTNMKTLKHRKTGSAPGNVPSNTKDFQNLNYFRSLIKDEGLARRWRLFIGPNPNVGVLSFLAWMRGWKGKNKLSLNSVCTWSWCHSAAEEAAAGLNSELAESIILTHASCFEGLYYV